MTTKDNRTADTEVIQGDNGERQQMLNQHRSQIRVLHVDDTPAIVEMNRRSLEQYDERIELEGARNAREGLERLADEGFDCIVSDYEMPGMNGLEFLEAVRNEYMNLPFILYTTKPCEAVIREALTAGVTDYVQKEGGTAHLAVLANRIVNAVESWRRWETQNRLLEAEDTYEDGR
jgi:CheY-like chemotaxis protein